MDIYDSDKPQKNLSSDVAKRDIAAIERCHLRQCHLTPSKTRSRFSETVALGETHLCQICPHVSLAFKRSFGRQKSFYQFFDRWLVGGTGGTGAAGGVGTSADSVRNLHSLTDQFQTFHPRISFANATSVAMTSIGQTI